MSVFQQISKQQSQEKRVFVAFIELRHFPFKYLPTSMGLFVIFSNSAAKQIFTSYLNHHCVNHTYLLFLQLDELWDRYRARYLKKYKFNEMILEWSQRTFFFKFSIFDVLEHRTRGMRRALGSSRLQKAYSSAFFLVATHFIRGSQWPVRSSSQRFVNTNIA